MKLLSGSCCLPHPDKEETGGEDAHFISDEQAVGVADGGVAGPVMVLMQDSIPGNSCYILFLQFKRSLMVQLTQLESWRKHILAQKQKGPQQHAS